MWSMRDSKDDIDVYQAYGNDEDGRRMSEYIRLGYKIIKVFIKDDNTTMYTYINAAYNTQTKKCVIMEIPDGVSPKNAPISKMKPRRLVLGEEDFDPFFGLDSQHVDSTTTRNECADKGKRVALNDDQVHIAADNVIEIKTVIKIVVKTIGNKGTLEFNADEDFDIGIDVIDTEESESASDENGIDMIRNFVHRHSIKTRRALYLKKNDKVRVKSECRGGKPTLRKVADNQRPWVLHVSNLQDSETWPVKTFDDTYKCRQSRKIKYYATDFLSQDIIDQIKTNPEVSIKPIQEQLQRKFQLEVSRIKAFREKVKIVDHVRGDFTLQQKYLRDYVMELQQSNPTTTVEIRVESEVDHMKPTRIFKRIYVCLGAAKEGFKACMRQFLRFNGTIMHEPFPRHATNKGKQPTADANKLVNKGKKQV
nr:hypothetical protein [Tanacetum cinerariifolium]